MVRAVIMLKVVDEACDSKCMAKRVQIFEVGIRVLCHPPRIL